MRRGRKVILLCIVLAIAITILSGLVNVTPQGILGAAWHGWPLAWRYVIVYPGSPESYDFNNFAIDVLVWFVPILAVAGILSAISSRKPSDTV